MSRKNKRVKSVRTIGKHKRVLKRSKASKKKCALSKTMLHGVPHGKRTAHISKLSKTQKRPTGMFGGILNSKERTHIIEEAIRVKTGLKQLEEIKLEEKAFVEQAIEYLNKKK